MQNDDLELATTQGDESGPVAARSESELLERGATLGRYMIVELLGAGGMGIVYSAFDPQLDRKIACKVLRKKWDDAGRLRLQREAKAMAKLSHPNVVSVYEVDSDGEHVYVAMELVDGEDIDRWCRRSRSADEILKVYIQAGQGLAAAHQAGLVHRDFKPHNVLINQDGRVMVTDFGLARQDSLVEEILSESPADGVLPSDSLTRTGVVMGTPAYMAPEQHLAEGIDSRSDQFSFCVSLYEALSGRRPYKGDTYLALKEQVTTQTAAALPESVEVSAAVREALARGLSRLPEDRFESMQELLGALSSRKPRKRRSRLPLYLSAALLMALTGGVVFLLTGNRAASSTCVADRSILIGSWDQQIRSTLAKAFSATGVPGADTTFTAFAASLDAYGEELVDLRLEICESSREAKDGTTVLQMVCLQEHKQDLAALSSAFARVEARFLGRAVELAQELPPVSDCRDIEALESGVAAPPTHLRREVEALQATIKEAESMGRTGQIKSAIAMAEAVRDRSKEIAYRPLRADAHLVLGVLLMHADRVAEARQALEESVLAAEESDHAKARTRALVLLTELLGESSSDFAEARRYARQAKAAINHLGSGSEAFALQLDVALALIKHQEGETEAGLALLQAALLRAESQAAIRRSDLIKVQHRIVRLQMEVGEVQAANQLAQRTHAAVYESLGPNHPRSARYLATLLETYRRLGDFEQAHVHAQELRAYWASDSGQSLLRERKGYQPLHRKVSGIVVDQEGAPIRDATVACGYRIYADGRYIDAAWDSHKDALHRLRVVRSDRDGRFACEGTTTMELIVVADHPLGRSAAVHAEASTSDVTDLRVHLLTAGRLAGEVKGGGNAERYVIAAPMSEKLVDAPHNSATVVRNGSYQFQRLAPGDYHVYVDSKAASGKMSVDSRKVHITAGEATTLNFEDARGDAGLRFTVAGAHGAPIPSVQVLVVPGQHSPKTGKQFGEQVYAKGVSFRAFFLVDGETLSLDDLSPGPHSLCLIPLDGDHRNLEFMKQFTPKRRDALPVYCHSLDLKAGETFEDQTRVPAP